MSLTHLTKQKFTMLKSVYNFTRNDLNKNVLLSFDNFEDKLGLVNDQIKLLRRNQQSGSVYKFKEVNLLNQKSPQLLGQQPITFFRQVMSGLLYPELVKTNLLSEDVKNRVKFYLSQVGHQSGIGAYTDPRGYEFVRKSIAEFILKRDKIVDVRDDTQIVLSNGMHETVDILLQTFIKHYRTGVMIPTPGIHYYSTLISQCGGSECQYKISEGNQWEVKLIELDNQYQYALSRGVTPKIIMVTNPGDPVGQVYSKSTIQKIIQFACDNQMIIIVDETYQMNVNNDRAQFVSFKQAKSEMHPRFHKTPLVSLNSASYGFVGEMGSKSGYMEFSAVPPEIIEQVVNLQSIHVCPNTIGQLYLDLMCNPPSESTTSRQTHEQFLKEVEVIKQNQKHNADLAYEYFNEMQEITLQPMKSYMYAYPKIEFREKIIKNLKQKNYYPDVFWCLKLLQDTGVAVVPGSAFNQQEGYYFRLSLSQNAKKFEDALKKIKLFNTEFHKGDWM